MSQVQAPMTSAISVALTPSELALWRVVDLLEQLDRDTASRYLGDELYQYATRVRGEIRRELLAEGQQVRADVVHIVRPDPARPGKFEIVTSIPVPKD